MKAFEEFWTDLNDHISRMQSRPGCEGHVIQRALQDVAYWSWNYRQHDIDRLKDFIADLDAVQNSDSTFTELRIILKADGERRKLWCDLHLEKYPSDY